MIGAHQTITDLFISKGYVSNWECIDRRITTRLSSVIERLRKRGWVVRTEIKDNKDCIYHLVSRPEALKCHQGEESSVSVDTFANIDNRVVKNDYNGKIETTPELLTK